MPVEQNQNDLLTPLQAAAYLQVAKGTLAQWRCTNRVKLPFVKMGNLVRYRPEDLANFVQERRNDSQ